MTTFGMPTSMFLVFVATVLAGSLGALHYLVWHVILGRPFAEVPPPVVQEGRVGHHGAGGVPGPGSGSGPGSSDAGGRPGG